METEFAELVEKPCGAGGFDKGRRGDGEQLKLPAAELRLVQTVRPRVPSPTGCRLSASRAANSISNFTGAWHAAG